MSASAPPCPACAARYNIVRDSRPSGKTIRRRRECRRCSHRFSTYEITDAEMETMRQWRAKSLSAALILRELADYADSLQSAVKEPRDKEPRRG